MAAYFTAIVRAPLTGILLITEMTGSYEQMLPLLTSSFCAYVVAEYLRDLPIYEALLERDLERGGFGNGRAQPIVAEFEIEPRCTVCWPIGARTRVAVRMHSGALRAGWD
jgi:CIC family chloride channel protein